MHNNWPLTKHRVDFDYFLSVKNMSEEGLEHDHITANTTIYCVIPLQLDNQTIYDPMTTDYRVSCVNKKYSASR